MNKTIQDELREICKEKEMVSWHCSLCPYRATGCGEGCCGMHAADTLLAALEARGLEIMRKGAEA